MNSKTALTEAISITDEILSVLDDQDFSRVDELEARRQLLIRQAFAQSVEEIDRIKAIHLQNLNQQVVNKLSEFKQVVLQQQKQISTASKATKAYQSHEKSAVLSASP